MVMDTLPRNQKGTQLTTQTTLKPRPTSSAPTAPATIEAHALLRRLFSIDAVIGLPMALAFVIFAGRLSQWLGLPSLLLTSSGAFLLVWAVAWTVVARTRPHSLIAAAIIVAMNLAWTALSIAIAAGAWFEPSSAGIAIVAAQALFPVSVAVPQAIAAVAMYRHRKQSETITT